MRGFGRELHLEAPEHAGEDEAHFEISETVITVRAIGALLIEGCGIKCKSRDKVIDLLPTNAATRTNRERLRGFLVVARKAFSAEPAVWREDVGVGEIERAAVCSVGAVLHVCLVWERDQPVSFHDLTFGDLLLPVPTGRRSWPLDVASGAVDPRGRADTSLGLRTRWLPRRGGA